MYCTMLCAATDFPLTVAAGTVHRVRELGYMGGTGQSAVVHERLEHEHGIGHRVDLEQRPEVDQVAEDVDQLRRSDAARWAVHAACEDVVRVCDRSEEHPDEEENVGEVLDIAVKDVAYGEQQRQPEGEGRYHRHHQEDRRDKDERPPVAEPDDDHQEQPHLDQVGDHFGGNRRPWDQLTGEIGLLDEVLVTEQGPHRLLDAALEKVPRQHRRQQHEGVIVEPARHAEGRLDLQQQGEHDRVHGHVGKGVDHRPAPADDRALVLGTKLAKRQVVEELFVLAVLTEFYAGVRSRSGRNAPPRPSLRARAVPIAVTVAICRLRSVLHGALLRGAHGSVLKSSRLRFKLGL